ncbi:hypothetical protein MLD38_015507 [Melastoma candidum]|uniref:Uncharacterized protein n=1 Tax=Melastoma candidum TaxID=119954 RepID=A0ACB9RHP1_9MYRT|nr:hypothetical protein MLD38_015507 [Melastoma candidum]
MEKTSPSKKLLMELARESLIAISSSVPDDVAGAQPESLKTATVSPLPNGDSAEKYRSELMSISLQSPEPKGLPLPNGDSAEKYRSELISLSEQSPEPKGLPVVGSP